MTSEKPTKVEVGQKWGPRQVVAVYDGGCEGTQYCGANDRSPKPPHVHYAADDRGWQGWDRIEALLEGRHYQFVGWVPGYGPTPETAKPVMEAREYVWPSGGRSVLPCGCLRCGLQVDANRFACLKCVGEAKSGELNDLKVSWDAGARDLPRPPAPSKPPEAPPAEQFHGPSIPAMLAKYGRLIGESRALDGTPLTCLQAIPCKRSSEDKPAPRWVPSCDIDADIPDA